jgi:hypothetical protein
MGRVNIVNFVLKNVQRLTAIFREGIKNYKIMKRNIRVERRTFATSCTYPIYIFFDNKLNFCVRIFR